MIQRIAMQLPFWARPSHPVVRYELGKPGTLSRRGRYVRAFFVVMIVLILGLGGYMIATGFLNHAPLLSDDADGQHVTATLMAILFWPVLVIQIVVRIIALLQTANLVGEARSRGTWDSLRATENGTELALRARWAVAFYRLRGMIALLLAVRLIFLVGILVDLTAFRGQYLSMLTVNIVPDIPLAIAAVLLVCWMTASLLLPFTGIGVDAALGLLISTLFQQRIYALLAQFVVIALRISVVILLLLGMTQLLAGELSDLSEQVSWLLMGGFSALGDWGLRFTHLQSFGGLWSIVPYGVFLGLGLVIYVVVQALFTDLLLSLAVRRAERAG